MQKEEHPIERDKKSSEQNSVKMEVLGRQRIEHMTAVSDLYRPIQEAANAELARSEAGTELIKDRHALTEEIRRLHEQIESKRLTNFEARRAIRSKRELLRAKHHATWLDAHALNARFQPSLEQILTALNLDWRHQLVWQAEVLPFESFCSRRSRALMIPEQSSKGWEGKHHRL
jgi:hypothetical protein